MVLWFLIGLGLFAILAISYYAQLSSAKKKAKRILEAGRIDDQKEFDSICDSLRLEAKKDIESEELWKQLQTLKTAEVK